MRKNKNFSYYSVEQLRNVNLNASLDLVGIRHSYNCNRVFQHAEKMSQRKNALRTYKYHVDTSREKICHSIFRIRRDCDDEKRSSQTVFAAYRRVVFGT